MFLPVLLFAQAGKKEVIWAPFKFFVGRWEGTGSGQPGASKVEREYRFVLGGKFLKAENKSTYEPQEDNPKGEVHQDLGLFSFDSARKKFVLRQFHAEGFINQYVLDSLSTNGRTISFTTESIENIPAGWRAKETYRILSDSEFVETFSLAAPGKEFEMYSENRLKRKK
ncbi:MAG: heme-binding beta-barrel domain-containing protein [candidate division Zixibacteria bacterium]|nr:heme-binding beta-barrel domain-containing protein [candidate division Zixibacteria bacterium]